MTSVVLALLPANAQAQQQATEPSAPIAVDFTVTAVSDYRYRGISLSDKKPAVQADLTVTHESGLYATVWVSSIADNGGADIENQIMLGKTLAVGGMTLDIQADYYLYPGASRDNYAEVAARLGGKLGGAEVGATISYASAQRNIGGVDNLYLGLDGSLPLPGTPISVTGSFGFEDGAFGDEKLDWSLGLSADAGGCTFGLGYVDTARSSGYGPGKPTVVGSISKTF